MFVDDELLLPGPWLAFQIRPNQQSIAERHLLRQGFTVFLPAISKEVRMKGRLVPRRQLFFPGYGFVTAGTHANFGDIDRTPGIVRLLRRPNGHPGELPRGFIAQLRARCSDDGLYQTADALEAGMRVRLLNGPFAELVTKIERIDAERRVWILLELLGGLREIQVSRDSLVPEGADLLRSA